MQKSSCALFVITLICALAISPASSRLVATGVEFMANATPGEHVSHDLIMSLSSDEAAPLNLTVDVLDWYQDLSALNIGVKENPNISPYSAKRFLSASPRNFSINPGTSQTIKIEGDMPAGDGGRYAIVLVHTVPQAAKGGQGVAVTFGMNTLVLLTISGSKLIKTGEIENLSLMEPILSKQQNISMTFKNTGNYHYKANASVNLKDGKGNILASASPVIRKNIIPTTLREIKFSMIPKVEIKPGIYTIEAKVTLEDGTVLATKEIGFEIKT